MTDEDHKAGIRAGVAALEGLYKDQACLPTKNAEGSIKITIIGISQEQVVETVVAAYLAGSHS